MNGKPIKIDPLIPRDPTMLWTKSNESFSGKHLNVLIACSRGAQRQCLSLSRQISDYDPKCSMNHGSCEVSQNDMFALIVIEFDILWCDLPFWSVLRGCYIWSMHLIVSVVTSMDDFVVIIIGLFFRWVNAAHIHKKIAMTSGVISKWLFW